MAPAAPGEKEGASPRLDEENGAANRPLQPRNGGDRRSLPPMRSSSPSDRSRAWRVLAPPSLDRAHRAGRELRPAADESQRGSAGGRDEWPAPSLRPRCAPWQSLAPSQRGNTSRASRPPWSTFSCGLTARGGSSLLWVVPLPALLGVPLAGSSTDESLNPSTRFEGRRTPAERRHCASWEAAGPNGHQLTEWIGPAGRRTAGSRLSSRRASEARIDKLTTSYAHETPPSDLV